MATHLRLQPLAQIQLLENQNVVLSKILITVAFIQRVMSTRRIMHPLPLPRKKEQ